MSDNNKYTEWKHTKADIFWGEIAPSDHVLQIYENDGVFLDALAGFVGGGINANDCCVVIATNKHLHALESRLQDYGIHIKDLVSEKRYIPLIAEEVLSRFMINGWPDEHLFNKTISSILKKDGGKQNIKIRAFGEMVAILWAQGNNGATVQLEHLWNQFCKQNDFCLFCAYPKSGFTNNINESLDHICCAHSKMIAGTEKQLTEIYYKEMPFSKAV